MKYLFLALAIVFEILGSSFIQASDGFTKWLPTTIVAIAHLISFYFLSLVLKTIPLGVAYAIWGGVGIVLTTTISILIFKQKLDIPALIGIVLIILGVITINFFSQAVIPFTKSR
ncbi:MAG: multidrug efflux SMR transporter [Edaphocola sp.]